MVQIIRSVVLVCCDLFRSLSSLINGTAVYWVNFNFYMQGNKILKVEKPRIKCGEHSSVLMDFVL